MKFGGAPFCQQHVDLMAYVPFEPISDSVIATSAVGAIQQQWKQELQNLIADNEKWVPKEKKKLIKNGVKQIQQVHNVIRFTLNRKILNCE